MLAAIVEDPAQVSRAQICVDDGLRQLGTFFIALRLSSTIALAEARPILALDSKAAKWITRDAIRALENLKRALPLSISSSFAIVVKLILIIVIVIKSFDFCSKVCQRNLAAHSRLRTCNRRLFVAAAFESPNIGQSRRVTRFQRAQSASAVPSTNP